MRYGVDKMKFIFPYLLFLLLIPLAAAFEASLKIEGVDSETTLVFGAEEANSTVISPPPPPTPPYIDAYFLEKEGKFHRLIKEYDDNINYYVFVDYNTENDNKNLNLSWDIKDLSSEYNISLLDNFDKIDMRKNKRHSIDAWNEGVLVISLEKKDAVKEEKKKSYLDDIVLIGLLALVIIILFTKRFRNKNNKKNS